jgi:hypothetical protein
MLTLIGVADHGVGMNTDDLTSWNEWLRYRGADILSVRTGQLGLAVVAGLAAAHNIDVTLTHSPGRGITAVVVVPTLALSGQHRRQSEDRRRRGLAPWQRPSLGAPPPRAAAEGNG